MYYRYVFTFWDVADHLDLMLALVYNYFNGLQKSRIYEEIYFHISLLHETDHVLQLAYFKTITLYDDETNTTSKLRINVPCLRWRSLDGNPYVPAWSI